MEFNEKLQELRKQRKITQQQLADAIYVSRTAISKWESGRGFPNIDSLKSIAAYFNVTVDELLSTEEAIKIADESQKQTVNNYRTLVFGFLDLGAALLLFLPLFAIRDGDIVVGGSLFFLSGMTEYIRLAFFSLIVTTVLFGCLPCPPWAISGARVGLKRVRCRKFWPAPWKMYGSSLVWADSSLPVPMPVPGLCPTAV